MKQGPEKISYLIPRKRRELDSNKSLQRHMPHDLRTLSRQDLSETPPFFLADMHTRLWRTLTQTTVVVLEIVKAELCGELGSGDQPVNRKAITQNLSVTMLQTR